IMPFHTNAIRMRPGPPIAGFAIVEIIFAIGIVAVLGVAATLALLQLNRMAVASRCYTGAEAIAQNQIDRILSQPYPEAGPAPSELMPGTTTQTGVQIYK